MKVWLSRNAKRLAALTLALVLVLALAACGSKTQTPETSSTPTIVTPPVQTPADPTSDPARPAGTETDQLTTVLDDIEKNVQLGVTGSSLKAVPYAVKLLDWGAASTMTQSEIKSAVVAWLSDKGNDAQVSFSQQMDLIDTTCQASWAAARATCSIPPAARTSRVTGRCRRPTALRPSLRPSACADNLQAENRHAPARRNGAQGRGFCFAAGAQPW